MYAGGRSSGDEAADGKKLGNREDGEVIATKFRAGSSAMGPIWRMRSPFFPGLRVSQPWARSSVRRELRSAAFNGERVPLGYSWTAFSSIPLSAHLDSISSQFLGQPSFGLTTGSQGDRLAYSPRNLTAPTARILWESAKLESDVDLAIRYCEKRNQSTSTLTTIIEKDPSLRVPSRLTLAANYRKFTSRCAESGLYC
jgi:hypothetical protein